MGQEGKAGKVPVSPFIVLGSCCVGATEVAGELSGKAVVVTEHRQELYSGVGKGTWQQLQDGLSDVFVPQVAKVTDFP